MKWTKSQQQVIDTRNRNLLVSAAAGSGKTAVLVERIIDIISDEEKNIDIDRLLIVTFTNAAAAEMRERIADGIEKRLEEDIENEHLQKQSGLLPNARISTIHSFCAYLIKNYFGSIELDPSFRLMDEGEGKLLKEEVLDEILENAYEKKEEDFLTFVEAYATGKKDDILKELILKLYDFSMSYPWPEEFLESCIKNYDLADEEKLCKADWMKELISSLSFQLREMEGEYEKALNICREPDGPYMYEERLLQEKNDIKEAAEKNSFEAMRKAVTGLQFQRLPSKKDESVSKEKRERVKELRDNQKKCISRMMEKFFSNSLTGYCADMKESQIQVQMLCRLTREFTGKLSEKKRERNLLDFHDLEHFALKILVDEKTKEPTQTAKELSETFEEIMIDEYQDSNRIQEEILVSISGQRKGKNNIFMVGDVKQSIYRFRLARPELFMEKYATYTTQESDCQKICLRNNFRSREEVLDSVNELFYHLMHRKIGNVEYDEDAALYAGNSMEKAKGQSYLTEVLVLEPSKEEEENLSKEQNRSKIEWEADLIAGRIEELFSEKFQILDKQSSEFRDVKYSDIVILLRSVSGVVQPMMRVLKERGIPVATTSQTGYFSTYEIRIMLSFLSVLNNPLQEIEFAAVLKSPFVKLSSKELAILKSSYGEKPIYEDYLCCEREKKMEEKIRLLEDGELKEKLDGFYQILNELRNAAMRLPIHELIYEIFDRTNYFHFIRSMPAGEQRAANLEMLVEKAMEFEKTSYRGLFHFIRYIEKMKKYELDYGEAGIVGENENAVRIMSIHKSKGLEFPIVFVSGMGKNFNQMDARAKIILHPEYGLGVDFIDIKNRVHTPTLLKNLLSLQTMNENLGEELRVLYVALTRAREKLILTGTYERAGEWENFYEMNGQESITELPSSVISEAKCYFDWIFSAMYAKKELFDIKKTKRESLGKKAVLRESKKRIDETIFWNCPIPYDEKKYKELKEEMEWKYPYEEETSMKMKMSVSELKKEELSQEEDNPVYEILFPPDTQEHRIPSFLKEEQKKKIQGTEVGNAYHKVMELLRFSEIENGGAAAFLDNLVKFGRMSEEMVSLVDSRKIENFLNHPLAKRMAKAEGLRKLYREQPFVFSLPACEIPGKNSMGNEEILIQGVIDVFWMEEDGIVLMDYKTDRVKTVEELTMRYHAQLDYYARALERLTGKKVKEKIFYSFTLSKAVSVV